VLPAGNIRQLADKAMRVLSDRKRMHDGVLEQMLTCIKVRDDLSTTDK
jgi:hypothetical protein